MKLTKLNKEQYESYCEFIEDTADIIDHHVRVLRKNKILKKNQEFGDTLVFMLTAINSSLLGTYYINQVNNESESKQAIKLINRFCKHNKKEINTFFSKYKKVVKKNKNSNTRTRKINVHSGVSNETPHR